MNQETMQAILKRLPARQQRMFMVLLDGLPHKREELFACIDDDLAKFPQAIQNPISDMRPVLMDHDMTVICHNSSRHGIRYQLFQLVKAPSEAATA